MASSQNESRKNEIVSIRSEDRQIVVCIAVETSHGMSCWAATTKQRPPPVCETDQVARTYVGNVQNESAQATSDNTVRPTGSLLQPAVQPRELSGTRAATLVQAGANEAQHESTLWPLNEGSLVGRWGSPIAAMRNLPQASYQGRQNNGTNGDPRNAILDTAG